MKTIGKKNEYGEYLKRVNEINLLEIERCEIHYLGRNEYFGQMWSIDFTLKKGQHLYRTDVALNGKNYFSIGRIENRSARLYGQFSNIERDHLLEQLVPLIKKYSKQRVKMIVSNTFLVRVSGNSFIPLEEYPEPKEIKIID